jgi:hypothetical protein
MLAVLSACCMVTSICAVSVSSSLLARDAAVALEAKLTAKARAIREVQVARRRC